MKYVVEKSKCLTTELSEDVCNVRTTELFLFFNEFTGVVISSDCSRIRFLLKRHKKNVTTFCSRVFNNRSVTLKL